MSRSITQPANITKVSPGTQVIVPMYTDTGFDAGDYVYAYGAGSVGFGGKPSVTAGYTSSTMIAGTSVSAPAGKSTTATYKAASLGPIKSSVASPITRTQGNALTSATITVASSSQHSCTALNNGTLVVVYQNSSTSTTLQFQIFDPGSTTFTSIAGPTTVTTTFRSANIGLVAVDALTDGGFIIVYGSTTDASRVYWKRYNSAGTEGATGDRQAAASVTCLYFEVCGLSNGGWAVVSRDTGLTGSQRRVWTFDSSNVYQNQAIINGTGNSFVSAFSEIPRMCASSTGVHIYHTSYTSGFYYSDLHYVSNAGGAGGFVQFSGVSGSYQTAPVSCPAVRSDGTIAILVGSSTVSTSLLYNTYTHNGSSYTSAGTQTLTTVVSLNNLYYVGIVSSGSNFYGTYNNSGGGGNNGIFLPGTPSVTGTPLTMDNYSRVRSLNDGTIATTAVSGTTLTIYRCAIETVAATNVSVSYGPSSNYYLIGVAASTAAAGTYGQVVINGPADLSSTYPNVATSINFDYTGYGPFAQKGNVIGRKVILKGLE